MKAVATLAGLLLVLAVGAVVVSGKIPHRAGTMVRLETGAGDTAVAVDYSAFGKFSKLAVQQDSSGVSEMIDSGQLFLVPDGTQAEVVSPGIVSTEVRIVGGAHAGRTGLVSSDFAESL